MATLIEDLGSVVGVPGSYLGEYYMTIRLAKYSRPSPFNNAKFDTSTIIHLPLPSEMRDDVSVEYSGSTPLNTVGDVFNGGGPLQGAGALGAIALRNAGTAASATLGAGAGMIGGSMFGSGFGDTASKTTEDLFPPDQLNSAIQQTAGMAPNPNPSIMFTGPNLREFQFSWTLYAKSPEESANIRKLIHTLKKRALPENFLSGSAAVLNYPYMCQVNFYPWDSPGPGVITSEWGWNNERSIIKMKRCVMGAVNANYNPSNTPAFFEGTKEPVATQLSISFKEIEYMLSNDYGGGAGILEYTGIALERAGQVASALTGGAAALAAGALTAASISDPPSPENTTT